MTQAKSVIIPIACLAFLVGVYLMLGGWMMISSKYDKDHLLGLSRIEVIQRLGPPGFDPQTASTRPWNDADDGPDYLGYYQNWATCRITFKEGKVDSVQRSWK